MDAAGVKGVFSWNITLPEGVTGVAPEIIADANMLAAYITAYWTGGTAAAPKP
jgi:hypothetical protein